MSVRIKITAGGIYGADGEVAIGTELTLSEEPTAWVGRYEVISGGETEGKVAITNPAQGDDKLVAKHRGRGSYSIMRGDDEVAENLSKAEAEDFNAMSDEDKAAFVAL
jgi:hypothetical protein